MADRFVLHTRLTYLFKDSQMKMWMMRWQLSKQALDTVEFEHITVTTAKKASFIPSHSKVYFRWYRASLLCL